MACVVIGLAYYALQQVEGMHYEGKLFQSGWTIIPAFCWCMGLTELNWTELHCTALHCTALHCTALHCTALHCTALHCTALHCTALHCMHCTALHCTACTALHCTALHCIALHCTALHCTGLHYIALTLHYTTLLVFKRFFSAPAIFVAVSAIVHAAPIVGAAIWDEYASLRWSNSLLTSSTSFNQQTSFFLEYFPYNLLTFSNYFSTWVAMA